MVSRPPVSSRESRELSSRWPPSLVQPSLQPDQEVMGQDHQRHVMVPVTVLNPKNYETYVPVDLTERGGRPSIIPGGQILAQQAFDDSMPVILVSVFSTGAAYST